MPSPRSDDPDWVVSDQFGVPIPADSAALRAGGTRFLTEAFRSSGALTDGNAVARSRRFMRFPAGHRPQAVALRRISEA